VILGGGRRHFLPSADGGQRDDGRDLTAEAQRNGYQYVANRDELSAISEAPVLGLFSASHMNYEIDRNPAEQPSLAEMTAKALDLVDDDEDGYFLMVEASRIDHAGHNNDAAAHLHDILAYNEAVAVALEKARTDGNTLFVSVSDHETGGMSLGIDGVYAWDPAALGRVQASHRVMLDEALSSTTIEGESVPVIRPSVIQERTGIELDSDEIAQLRSNVASPRALNFFLSDLISRATRVGWTTSGHTAIDVSLYAYGPGAHRFRGNHDNTFIGETLADVLGFDLSTLTTDLMQRMDDTGAPSTGANQ